MTKQTWLPFNLILSGFAFAVCLQLTEMGLAEAVAGENAVTDTTQSHAGILAAVW